MDQIANWVRFADTKAAILAAGLGVVLTMLMTNAGAVVSAIGSGGLEAVLLYVMLTIAAGSFAWTLIWLLIALGPRRSAGRPGLNRFAWPTLADTTVDALIEHGRTTDATRDAWQQTIDLSRVAKSKFSATNRAIWGFGVVIVFAAALAGTANASTRSHPGSTNQSPSPATPSADASD